MVLNLKDLSERPMFLNLCEICLSYKDHMNKDSDHGNHDQCGECIMHAKHKERYTMAHIEYQKLNSKRSCLLRC